VAKVNALVRSNHNHVALAPRRGAAIHWFHNKQNCRFSRDPNRTAKNPAWPAGRALLHHTYSSINHTWKLYAKPIILRGEVGIILGDDLSLATTARPVYSCLVRSIQAGLLGPLYANLQPRQATSDQ
jgi:hypothetical protein